MKNKVLYQEYGAKVVPYSFDDFEDPNDEEYRLEQMMKSVPTINEDDEELSDEYFEMKENIEKDE